MNIALENILTQVTDSTLIDKDELTLILDSIPVESQPKDLQSIARLLFDRGKLTAYQARVIARGKGHLLLMKNYLILDKVGKGGMGTVFRAKHLKMNRDVAMKVLSRSHQSDPTVIQRFFREIHTAGMLSHPNIASAFDADQAHGHWFLVSEYIEGDNLGDLVEQNGSLSPTVAVDITLQSAIGLEFAHEAGVIHRDVKPANLMLDQTGNVKILDLGLAQFQSEKDQLKLTNTGTIIGTPHYMPPEQATSTHLVDARSDIYSLGCTLHYLLTGSPIYDEDTVIGTLMAHREQPLPNLKLRVQQLSPSIQLVFEKMVAKDPNDRYQRMSQVVEDLQLLKAERPLMYATCGSEILSEIRLKEFFEMLNHSSDQPVNGSSEYFLDDSQGSISSWDPPSVGVSALADRIAITSSPPNQRSDSPRSRSEISQLLIIAGAAVVLTSVFVWILF